MNLNLKDEICTVIIRILKETLNNDLKIFDINENTNLKSELFLDSIALLSLIAQLENHYNLVLIDEDAESDVVDSVASLTSYVESKLQKTIS